MEGEGSNVYYGGGTGRGRQWTKAGGRGGEEGGEGFSTSNVDTFGEGY
jgi:hypothetical protein